MCIQPETTSPTCLPPSSSSEGGGSEAGDAVVEFRRMGRSVADGTRCRPHSLDMCIRGKCRVRNWPVLQLLQLPGKQYTPVATLGTPMNEYEGVILEKVQTPEPNKSVPTRWRKKTDFQGYERFFLFSLRAHASCEHRIIFSLVWCAHMYNRFVFW